MTNEQNSNELDARSGVAGEPIVGRLRLPARDPFDARRSRLERARALYDLRSGPSPCSGTPFAICQRDIALAEVRAQPFF